MNFLIIIALVLITILALFWLLVPAVYGLPPISTKPERIRRALHLADLQPGEKFYDLGSGHGSVLIIAAKEFGAYAIGIEAGPVQNLISQINAIWNGVNSRVKVETGNFYRSDISDADVVFAYLTSKYALPLEQKFESELKRGTRVVTISFNLPNWQPISFDREQLIFLYQK